MEGVNNAMVGAAIAAWKGAKVRTWSFHGHRRSRWSIEVLVFIQLEQAEEEFTIESSRAPGPVLPKTKDEANFLVKEGDDGVQRCSFRWKGAAPSPQDQRRLFTLGGWLMDKAPTRFTPGGMAEYLVHAAGLTLTEGAWETMDWDLRVKLTEGLVEMDWLKDDCCECLFTLVERAGFATLGLTEFCTFESKARRIRRKMTQDCLLRPRTPPHPRSGHRVTTASSTTCPCACSQPKQKRRPLRRRW